MRRVTSLLLLPMLLTLGSIAHGQSPDTLIPITAANADQVTALAVLGRGIGGQALWSPDGETLAIASSLGVWLLDGHDLTAHPHLLDSPAAGVYTITFSANSQFLAAGLYNDSIAVWDTTTGHLVHQVELPSLPNVLVFSPDGTMLASGHGDYMGGRYRNTNVRLWDVASMEILAVLEAPVLEVEALDFSADGRFLVAAGFEESVRIWDVQRVLNTQDDSVLEDVVLTGNAPVKFSDQRHLLAYAGLDDQVRVWDVDAEASVRQFPAFTGFRFDTLDFRGDEVIIQRGAPSYDGNWVLSREIWNLKTTTPESVSTTLESLIFSVTYRQQDGTIVSTHSDGVLRVWDEQLNLQSSLLSFGETIDDISFSPSGNALIAGSADFSVIEAGVSRLYRWDVAAALRGESSPERLAYDRSSVRIDSSPNGMLLAIAGGYFAPQITLLDLDTQQEQTIYTPDENVVDVAFSPDGSLISSLASAGVIRLWDAQTGTERVVLREQPDQWMRTIGFSPDGRWLAASYLADRHAIVELWDVEASLQSGTGKLDFTLLAASRSLFDMPFAFSADTARLAMVGYDAIVIWDIATQTQQLVIENTKQVQALAFSPDGSALAAAFTDRLRPVVGLWDANSGEQVALLEGHKNGISALKFNADGSLLASGSLDGTVRLWGIPTAQLSLDN